MINTNGIFVEKNTDIIAKNRGFLYGDAVFETIKTLDGKPLFLEEHYFRLMAALRVFRIEIPLNFTLEFFENEIIKTIQAQKEKANSYRVRITCYRVSPGKYLPKDREMAYIIEATPLQTDIYSYNETDYEVELYKDFYVTAQLLSSIKTTNKALHVLAAIYADENGYQNVFLVNDKKNIIETTNGNIFMVKGNEITTPPVSEGCVAGIMRKKVIEKIKLWKDFTFIEKPISPFDLQKADELWSTNVIQGIQPISKYRKKTFTNDLAKKCTQQINIGIRLM